MDIRRIVNVGLDAEQVTAPEQGRARLFSGHPVPALHHRTADPGQQGRSRQLDIVHHRLEVVPVMLGDARMA